MDRKQQNQEWETRIADFKTSGQTMSVWCGAHGVTTHQLKYWLKKRNNQDRITSPVPSTNWLPVSPSDAVHNSAQAPGLVVRVGQASIEVPSDFNPHLLREILRILC